MNRSIPGVGLNNANAIMQNTNSTLDQRQKMSPTHKQGIASNLSSIVK